MGSAVNCRDDWKEAVAGLDNKGQVLDFFIWVHPNRPVRVPLRPAVCSTQLVFRGRLSRLITGLHLRLTHPGGHGQRIPSMEPFYESLRGSAITEQRAEDSAYLTAQ